MDVGFGEQRLAVQPQHLLRHLIETVRAATQSRPAAASTSPPPKELEQRLFSAVGPERRQEAEEIIAIGRLSWRIRDDDNILLARLEAQLLQALDLAAKRLIGAGRVRDPRGPVQVGDTRAIVEALLNPEGGAVALTPPAAAAAGPAEPAREGKPRQLLGQPAAPGMASGLVRIIDSASDLNRFRAGEVLVCRAIEPTMTHLAPLARAIIELRGGMLIHGAIIARELGIPCVNGIPEVMGLLKNGDLVTVDGYLGIVTVGVPEFDLEGVELGRGDAGSPTTGTG
jgi:pyruvate,water dikinase